MYKREGMYIEGITAMYSEDNEGVSAIHIIVIIDTGRAPTQLVCSLSLSRSLSVFFHSVLILIQTFGVYKWRKEVS